MEKFQKDSFQKADEIFNNLREQIDNIETVSQAIYEKVSKIEKQHSGSFSKDLKPQDIDQGNDKRLRMKKIVRYKKQRPLKKIMDDYQNALSGKEIRRLHKEMKKAGYGGFPIFTRYPRAPFVTSITAAVLVLLSIILHGMPQ